MSKQISITHTGRGIQYRATDGEREVLITSIRGEYAIQGQWTPAPATYWSDSLYRAQEIARNVLQDRHPDTGRPL